MVAIVKVRAKGDRVSKIRLSHPLTPVGRAGGMGYLPGMVGILVGLWLSGNNGICHEGKENLGEFHVGSGMYAFEIVAGRYRNIL
jgi:hypothetical protein